MDSADPHEIQGIAPSGSSLPYAVTKAAVIHLMKSLAQSQGPKVRVNAVAPGLMLTEWVSLKLNAHFKSGS